MKNTLFATFLALVIIAGLSSCCTTKCPIKKTTDKNKSEFQTTMDTVSYMIGLEIGSSFKSNHIDVNPKYLKLGVEDGMKGNDTLFTPETKDIVMTSFQFRLQQADMERREKISATNRQEEIDFLNANRNKEGVMETESGIQYRVIKLGDGGKPTATDTVRVHYEGRFIDGEVFDNSRNYGHNPVEFPLNHVIPGWTEALQLMPVGSEFEFYIPAALGYGERGNDRIEPGKMLIFKVELLGIIK